MPDFLNPVTLPADPATSTQAARKAYIDTAVQTLWTPARQGLRGWTFDPVQISANATVAVAGTLYLSLIEIFDTFTSTSLYWDVAVIAATVTAGQNLLGLYNPAGTLVWSAGVDSDILSTGLKETAMAVSMTPGQWRVGFLFNASTTPALARCGAVSGSVNAVNANISGSAIRGAVNGTGRTTLSNPVTLASNGSGTFHWAAIK